MNTWLLWLSKGVSWARKAMATRPGRMAFVPLFATLLLWLLFWSLSPQPVVSQANVQSPRSEFRAISGLVQAEMEPNRLIYLAAFTVTLNLTPTVPGTPPLFTTRTDEYARFVFPTLPQNEPNPDKYVVCWEATGWNGECVPATAQPMLVMAKPFTGTKMIWGRVTFDDGSSPWFVSPRFGITQTVEVLLTSSAITTCPPFTTANLITVPTTVWGDYVIVNPPGDEGNLFARFGDLTGTSSNPIAKQTPECTLPHPYSASANFASQNPERVQLPIKIANHPPIMKNIEVASSGGTVGELFGDQLQFKIFTPTQEVKVEFFKEGIEANLNRTFAYEWQAPFCTVPLTKTDSSITCLLPQPEGLYRFHMLLYDGHGVYIEESQLISIANAPPNAYKLHRLAGPFLQRKHALLPDGSDANEKAYLDAEAKGYYKVIDPEQRRLTLGSWWAMNGFDPTTGEGGIQAAYLNHNELGIGRNMNCLRSDERVACYVTNYGHAVQDYREAQNALENNRENAVATVAMEYSLVDGRSDQGPQVKFYAFRSGDGSGLRQTSANLDGVGDAYLPHLCLNCHGGDYIPPSPADFTQSNEAANPPFAADLNAYFLPFNLKNLRFPCPYLSSPECTQTTEIEEKIFYELNQLVSYVATDSVAPELPEPNTPAYRIAELVDGWYDAGATHVQDRDWVPSGWQTSITTTHLYQGIVGSSCRTCHVVVDSGNGATETYTDATDGWQDLILKEMVDKMEMPHSRITFINFHCPDGQGGVPIAQELADVLGGTASDGCNVDVNRAIFRALMKGMEIYNARFR